MARTIHLQPLSFSYVLLPLLSRRATPSSKLHLHHNFSSINRPYSSKTINKPPLMVVSAKAKRIFSSKKEEIASPSDLLFESPLKIVEYPDPVLRAPNKKILSFDENLKNLVHEMFDIMYKTDGVGLAAPQVGMNLRLMVFNPIGERGEGEEIVLVNPRVQKYSNKIIPFEEGCLSFPGIYADVEGVRLWKGHWCVERRLKLYFLQVYDFLKKNGLVNKFVLEYGYSCLCNFCLGKDMPKMKELTDTTSKSVQWHLNPAVDNESGGI